MEPSYAQIITIKIFRTTSLLILMILFSKCGPSHKRIEMKSDKHGGIYEISDQGEEYKVYGNTQSVRLNTSTFISFSDFELVLAVNSTEEPHVLNFKLRESGTLKLKQMTERNLQKDVCFVVDNQIMATVTVAAAIPDGLVTLTMPDKKAFGDIVAYLEK